MAVLGGRALERALSRQREQEARRRQQWELHRRCLQHWGLCSAQQARWGAGRARAERAPGGEERAARLTERRARLARLLAAEREALAAELQQRRRDEAAPERLRQRGQALCSAREERRRKVADDRLRQHWKDNSARLREIESELHKKLVIDAWGDQLKEKRQQEATEREEEKRFENEYERARREALERMKREEEKRRLEEKQRAEMLLQQMEELKLQETEATKLKKEQENLLKQKWELEELEEERKQMEVCRKKLELGRFLRHQYNAKLKQRAQQIQEELEMDRQILLALLEKEDEDQRLQSARRERAVADVAWMKRVIEEQLQLEREREAHLQTIFSQDADADIRVQRHGAVLTERHQDQLVAFQQACDQILSFVCARLALVISAKEEAKQVWERREEEWEKERKARDRLMNEVLAGRQRQIQEKMELNRRAQEDSVKQREELIRELEEAKELTRREREEEEELKTARKQELEAQLTERRLQEQEELERQRAEEEEERLAEQRHEELVQQEAKCMMEQGYCHRPHARLKTAWT